MRGPLLALALLLVGAGCKSAPSLVGTWTGNTKGMPATLEFKPDDTFAITMRSKNTTIVFTGEYKVSGDTVTETFRDVQLPGQPDVVVATVKKGMASEFDKPQVSKLTFASADSVTMSDKDGPIVLTRTKP